MQNEAELIYFMIKNILKRGGKRGGRCAIKNNLILENLQKCLFFRFSLSCNIEFIYAPPLPPLFKIFLIVKYINWASFCTKNEVHKSSRSIFTLILIWGDSQAKSMIFFHYEILFYDSLSHFLAKIEFFEFKALYILSEKRIPNLALVIDNLKNT